MALKEAVLKLSYNEQVAVRAYFQASKCIDMRGMRYSLFHKKMYAFTQKVLKKTSFLFFGTTVRIKH